MLRALQLRHLRLVCFFFASLLRCLPVSLVSALGGYFLTDEHSPGGPADCASSHLIIQVTLLHFVSPGFPSPRD